MKETLCTWQSWARGAEQASGRRTASTAPPRAAEKSATSGPYPFANTLAGHRGPSGRDGRGGCRTAPPPRQKTTRRPPRPNILLIVSDDMGWGQPGFNGGTEVLTPNMDRIAGEGIKLTQFYVQPQCAPSRASLLTGRYPWKNGVGTNPHPETNAGMLLDERTVAQALGDADYSTWIVGKWHLRALAPGALAPATRV